MKVSFFQLFRFDSGFLRLSLQLRNVLFNSSQSITSGGSVLASGIFALCPNPRCSTILTKLSTSGVASVGSELAEWTSPDSRFSAATCVAKPRAADSHRAFIVAGSKGPSPESHLVHVPRRHRAIYPPLPSRRSRARRPVRGYGPTYAFHYLLAHASIVDACASKTAKRSVVCQTEKAKSYRGETKRRIQRRTKAADPPRMF